MHSNRTFSNRTLPFQDTAGASHLRGDNPYLVKSLDKSLKCRGSIAGSRKTRYFLGIFKTNYPVYISGKLVKRWAGIERLARFIQVIFMGCNIQNKRWVSYIKN